MQKPTDIQEEGISSPPAIGKEFHIHIHLPQEDNVVKPMKDNTSNKQEMRFGGKPIVYIAEDGDTLFSIAQKFDIPLHKLIEFNDEMKVLTPTAILNPQTVVHAGMKIYIPIFN